MFGGGEYKVMESARPKVRAGSILHRLLGVTPGYAPMWLSSRDSCNGFDLLAAVQAAGFFTTIVLVWALRTWKPELQEKD